MSVRVDRGSPWVSAAARKVFTADPWPGDGGEKVSGVIVEPVDDLHSAAVGELPVGEVRLPALVGLVGLESPIRPFGSLLRFWADQPRSGENTTDGGG